jgi:hypothetical protein
MRLSFDDHESFKEAAGSLRFNNPPSDPNTHQQVGSSSMPPEESLPVRNEDNLSNDPNTLQRMGRSSTSIQETRARRSEDA